MPKKHYPFLTEYTFWLSTTKGIEQVTLNWRNNKLGGRHYYWLKETNISLTFFSIVKCFLYHVYAVLEFKSYKFFYSKYSLFPHRKYSLFSQKMSTYLHWLKKKVKSLKIENFDQTSKKRTPPSSRKFWPDSWLSAIQRFDSSCKKGIWWWLLLSSTDIFIFNNN